MPLRFYTVVVDSRDHLSLGTWWAETLGWQEVFRSADELAIVPASALAEAETTAFHDRRGVGLVFVPVPEDKAGKNRLHLDLAPHTSNDRDAEIAALLARGATLADVGQGEADREVSWTVLRDPEGNEFCVLSAREQ